MENSRLQNIKNILDDVHLIKGNLSNRSLLFKTIKKFEPEEVYNLGGDSFVPAAIGKPIAVGDITGLSAMRILEAIRSVDHNIKFYQASSSEMFGDATESPQNENTPFRPRNIYGVAKLCAHWATVSYRRIYDVFASCGICFNHESPRRKMEFVTRKITNTVAKIHLGMEKELKLGNLEAKRDWGYAPEYIKAMWLMLKEKEPGDFVIATGETHSVKDFVQKAFKIVDLEWEKYVKVDDSFFRPKEPVELCREITQKRRKNWDGNRRSDSTNW